MAKDIDDTLAGDMEKIGAVIKGAWYILWTDTVEFLRAAASRAGELAPPPRVSGSWTDGKEERADENHD